MRRRGSSAPRRLTTEAGHVVEIVAPAANAFPSSSRILTSASRAMDLAVKAARVKPKHGFLLYVTVVGDKRIRTLNKEHRRKDKATDVLSFPLYTGEDGFPGTGPEPLGDVVISRDTCRRQAARIGHSTADEFDRLLVHGILHLLGYDHETSAEDERRMQRLEDQILMGMQKSPSAR